MARRVPASLVAPVALTGLLAAFAVVAGLLWRGDLATTTVTTIRGDAVEVIDAGIHRFSSEPLVAEGIGWDLVTLLAVLPVLGLTLPAFARGSTRAALLTLGILAYLLY